jgi:hypothetical protein
LRGWPKMSYLLSEYDLFANTQIPLPYLNCSKETTGRDCG